MDLFLFRELRTRSRIMYVGMGGVEGCPENRFPNDVLFVFFEASTSLIN